MNYDFKMKNLLTLFGNNPEALANEFTKQLNAELEKENALSEATTQLIKAWNNFCDKYFLKNEIPKGYKVEDFYLKDTTNPKTLLDSILTFLFSLEKTEKVITDYASLPNKAITDFAKVFPTFIDKYIK